MKKIFTFIVAMVMTIMATAQTKNVEWTGALGMPYINLNAGAVTPLSNFNNFDVNAIQPAAGIELGTYVTPVWGASVEGVSVFNLKKAEDQTLLDRFYVLGNGKMNVSNFLAGYKGYPRRVEFVLVAGAGWERDYWKVPANELPNIEGDWAFTKADGETPAEPDAPVTPAGDYTLAHRDGMVYNTGAEINVNLGEKRAWQINLRPSVLWGHNAENPYGFKPADATARLNLGVTYKFGNRRIKSNNFVTNDYAVTQHDYDVLMARYEECHNRPAEVKEVPVEVVVEKPVVELVNVPTYFGENLILFPCGSAKLDANNKEILKHFVEDAQDNVLIYVVGSADSKTGSENFNYDLAGKRAKAVKDELVKLGLDEKDIAIDVTLDAGSTIKAARSATVTIMARPE